MKRLALTYNDIMAAGEDAGNRSMRRAARKKWNRADWDAAVQVTDTLFGVSAKGGAQ